MGSKAPFVIPEYLKKGFHKYKYILLVCVVGLVLVTLPQREAGKATETDEASYQLRCEAFEQALEEALSDIEGVGRVKVVLTLRSGTETIYAYNSNEQAEGERQTTMVMASGSQPVELRTKGPTFQGAVIVCDGADRAVTRLMLTEAVKALTGITTDNISILKMKQ